MMKHYSAAQHLNVGAGQDIAIIDLARLICDVVGFGGDIELDAGKPDGTPRKLLDVSRFRSAGWMPRIGLRDGIAATYAWFLENEASGA